MTGNLGYLREKYAIGFITIEELEEGLDSVLRGGPINVPKAARGEMVDAMCEYMARQSPQPGSNVTVDGRPGTVVEYLPGVLPGRPGLVTCTVTYVIDHGGELATYVVNDWDRKAPKVDLVS